MQDNILAPKLEGRYFECGFNLSCTKQSLNVAAQQLWKVKG